MKQLYSHKEDNAAQFFTLREICMGVRVQMQGYSIIVCDLVIVLNIIHSILQKRTPLCRIMFPYSQSMQLTNTSSVSIDLKLAAVT